MRLLLLGVFGVGCAGCCPYDYLCIESVGGGSYVAAEGPIDVTVTVCRNGNCDAVRLGGDPLVAGAGFQAGAPGTVSLLGGQDGPWFVGVEWRVGDVEFEDGDRYLVALVDESDQELLYDVEQEADYRERTCGCMMADIQLPQLVPGP